MSVLEGLLAVLGLTLTLGPPSWLSVKLIDTDVGLYRVTVLTMRRPTTTGSKTKLSVSCSAPLSQRPCTATMADCSPMAASLWPASV